ncbi:hypothetical protein PanWU01x14_255920 [Parasponia andersonii]|uniref:Uncharacterized protein n=1 Tax=Parasponia andersonii TaxID=3476 RepID=A0A2P5BAK0_PARAD|nr:hypothetical protein PanWU01x14_255920 [Parasponia andersonii]
MGSKSEYDINEKGIQAVVGFRDHKQQGMENKDDGDDNFVTQEERGKKAQVEKTTATERPKRAMKSIDKFTLTEKMQKVVPIKLMVAIQAPRKQRIYLFSINPDAKIEKKRLASFEVFIRQGLVKHHSKE